MSEVAKTSRAEEGKRNTRYDESRRLEERIREIDKLPQMSAINPFYIEPDKIPYGWSYAWIRFEFLGLPDTSRDATTKKQGWTPVPRDRHPELCLDGVSGGASNNGKYIQFRGLSLCEIPTEIHNKREKDFAKQEWERVNTLAGLDHKMMSDPLMPPKVFGNEVKRSFGVEK